jgi:hypothetical protein
MRVDDFKRPRPYTFHESISQIKGREVDSQLVIKEEWVMVDEKTDGQQEDSKEGKISRNRLIERIFIVTLVKNSFTNLVMNPEFLAYMFTSTETQQTERHSESFLPTIHRSGSMTVASTDNLTSTTFTHPQSLYLQPADGHYASEIHVTKVLCSHEDRVNWQSLKGPSSRITANIQCVAARLQKALLQSHSNYFQHLAKINYEVTRLAGINIFRHVTASLQTRNGSGISGILQERVKEDFDKIEMVIDYVQSFFSLMKADVLSCADSKRMSGVTAKLAGLCKCVNSAVEWQLNEMLLGSSRELRSTVRYLLLSFDVGGEQQRRFDRLLPKPLYIMKCEGIQEFFHQPDWMGSAFHPRSLYCHTFSPFMRRIHLARYYARHIMETIKIGRQVITRRHEDCTEQAGGLTAGPHHARAGEADHSWGKRPSQQAQAQAGREQGGLPRHVQEKAAQHVGLHR